MKISMHKKTLLQILAASALVFLCLTGAAFADDSAVQINPQGDGQQPPELPDGEQPSQGDGQQQNSDQTTASSPLSLLGILAGFGVAGIAVIRNRT